MSSRALRRMQRELEEEKLRQQDTASEEEEDDDDSVRQQPPKKSAFDLLNAMEDNDEDEDEDENNATEPAATQDGLDSELQLPKSAKKQKKKKKKKSKAKSAKEAVAEQTADPDMDEIDLALKSLGGTSKSRNGQQDLSIGRELERFYRLLAVEKQHLNSLNEMKKLFGSVVLERDDDQDATARRQRNNQGVAISDFLSARYSRVSRGQGLSGLALRQNVLLPGKPEWPKAASGGLSMELVERADDFTTEYRFVHNAMYQRVQKDFEQAVQTMDPQAMFQMVYNNPYHISSLLQTAEVLKHQGDHSVASDLYERALYSFGRSVQSTFAAALSEGKARMDFRRPENREFWLTAYRYIGSLVQKGTFRTAYEWAKLILSLDPEGDPYCIRLIMDQLALKGGQSQHLIDLASTNVSLIDWGQGLPNIRISLALAHFRTKQSEEAKDTLSIAVKDFPWIFARLFQQLDVEKTPKAIWGIQPRTDLEKFHTESYVVRAKDIWNTPESLSFLQSVVGNSDRADPPPKSDDRPISLDEARHAIVSEITSIIGTVPREYTTMRTTSSDPLPPPDSISSYDPAGTRADLESDDDVDLDERDMDRIIDQARRAARDPNAAAGAGVMGLLGRALNMFTGRGTAPRENPTNNAEGGDPEGPEDSLGRQMGMEEITVRSMAEYEEALNRGQWPVLAQDAAPEIMRQLQAQGDGREAAATPNDAAADEERRQRRQREEASIREAQSRHQATVEDDNSEDEVHAAAPSAQDTKPSIGSMSREEITEFLKKDYDNESNKRWLAGRGMLALKDFITEQGSDESNWLNDPRIDKTPVMEYLARTSLLKTPTDKNFILEYALKQGAGAQASEMILRLL